MPQNINKNPREQEESDRAPADDAVIGRAFRISLIVLVCIGGIVGLSILFLRQPDAPTQTETSAPVAEALKPARPVAADFPKIPFSDITREAGIEFVQFNGANGEKLLPETMGGGVAFLDYDNDGDQDLFFVTAHHWHDEDAAESPTSVLYANDGTGKFSDVSAAAGLAVTLYGMGVAVADYDADGWTDLFVTGVGRNRLFRNSGGRFSEQTSAGVGGEEDAWSTSAGFADFDRDGHLDLVVCNYVRWSRQIDIELDFQITGLGRAYGPPTSFEGTALYLYLNNGDGTFRDVSQSAGITMANPATGSPMAKALAVIPLDADGDGWLDFVVANDTVRNFFFRNRGDGTFEEVGGALGIAFDANGGATGAMGIDAAYYRNDDALAVAIGNFANEMSSLYVSEGGRMQFRDEAIIDGIGPASRRALTFGLFFFDVDLDGRLDLLQANGGDC